MLHITQAIGMYRDITNVLRNDAIPIGHLLSIARIISECTRSPIDTLRRLSQMTPVSAYDNNSADTNVVIQSSATTIRDTAVAENDDTDEVDSDTEELVEVSFVRVPEKPNNLLSNKAKFVCSVFSINMEESKLSGKYAINDSDSLFECNIYITNGNNNSVTYIDDGGYSDAISRRIPFIFRKMSATVGDLILVTMEKIDDSYFGKRIDAQSGNKVL